MKLIIVPALCALMVLSSAFLPADDGPEPRHILPIRGIEAIDGDSFQVLVHVWPGQMNQVILRLRGYDAPESTWRAKCEFEKKLGERAKAMADSLIQQSHSFELASPAWDKYGGRVIGDLLLDRRNIGPILKSMGLLQDYDGKGPKPGWCHNLEKSDTGIEESSWGSVKENLYQGDSDL